LSHFCLDTKQNKKLIFNQLSAFLKFDFLLKNQTLILWISKNTKIFFSKLVVCICNLTNLQSANYKHFLLQKM